MKYLIIVLLIVLAFHPLSFARFNWVNNNRLGAVGVVLLVLAAVIYPGVLVWIRY